MAATKIDLPKHDHPAVFSDALLDDLIAAIEGSELVVDGFSGTGRIHPLAEMAGVPMSVGVELEPEWSNLELFSELPRLQIIGDSRLVIPTIEERCGQPMDCFASSPTYANRMGDKHRNRDKCKKCKGRGCMPCRMTGLSRRNTYTHRLGRQLSEGNAGAMNWGADYRMLHAEVWAAAVRALAPGGKFVLNAKNHIRNHVEVDVIGWHVNLLSEFGLRESGRVEVKCPGQKNGANADSRVETESVVVFRKPKKRGSASRPVKKAAARKSPARKRVAKSSAAKAA